MKKFVIEDFVNSRKLAVLEDGKLQKLIIDEHSSKPGINTVYRGVIRNIVKDMNSCFIDIGEKNPVYMKTGKNFSFKEGDRILVQIIKEEKGNKRARVSEEISIAGRYSVYIPGNDRLVFSNKIKDNAEKERIRTVLRNGTGEENCFVVRTKAVDVTDRDIVSDALSLKSEYKKICSEYNSSFAPKMIYRPFTPVERYIFDNFDESVDEIAYCKGLSSIDIRGIVKRIDKNLLSRVKGIENCDIFEYYGVNRLLSNYLSRTVSLKGGSSIVIDRTEAMTVIDVNSGKHMKSGGFDRNIFSVNMAAAKAIVDQVCFRDISGIIIVDFIDMKDKVHRQMLLDELENGFRINGKKTDVHGFTKLGLVEISRRRGEKSIDDYYFMNNPREGYSFSYITDEVERAALHASLHYFMKIVEFRIHKEIYSDFLNKKSRMIELIENKYGVKIILKKI